MPAIHEATGIHRIDEWRCGRESQRACGNDQAVIRSVRERINASFDLRAIADVHWYDFHTQRRRYGLDRAEQSNSGGYIRISNNGRALQARGKLLTSSRYLPPKTYSTAVKPVALPPGCRVRAVAADLAERAPDVIVASGAAHVAPQGCRRSQPRPDQPLARIQSG